MKRISKSKDNGYTFHRAVDSEGHTVDFYLSESRNKQAAKRFYKKSLAFSYASKPCIITVDESPAYPITIQELKKRNKCLKAYN